MASYPLQLGRLAFLRPHSSAVSGLSWQKDNTPQFFLPIWSCSPSYPRQVALRKGEDFLRRSPRIKGHSVSANAHRVVTISADSSRVVTFRADSGVVPVAADSGVADPPAVKRKRGRPRKKAVAEEPKSLGPEPSPGLEGAVSLARDAPTSPEAAIHLGPDQAEDGGEGREGWPAGQSEEGGAGKEALPAVRERKGRSKKVAVAAAAGERGTWQEGPAYEASSLEAADGRGSQNGASISGRQPAGKPLELQSKAGPPHPVSQVEVEVVEEDDGLGRGKLGLEESSGAEAGVRAEAREGQGEGVGQDDGMGVDPFWGKRTVREICDRLLTVFTEEKDEVEEWKRLLAFSSEWKNIRERFYTRVKQRAMEEEVTGSPEEALRLYSFARRLAKVEEEIERHDQLLAELEAKEGDWEALISRRRAEFSSDFFLHLRILGDAAYDKPKRREVLASLASRLLVAVRTHDEVIEDEVATQDAQKKLLDILDSPDLASIDRKIDQLASTGGLDPALLLLMSKAYAKARDTDYTRDEVKDVMAHMYFKAKESMQRFLPKEVRILRHILSMEDPRERYDALSDAFTPGEELETENSHAVYTDPERLLQVVDGVLDAYFSKTQHGSLVKEAASLMRPAVIDRMRDLKEVIEKEYL